MKKTIKRNDFQPFTARLILLGLFFFAGLLAGNIAQRLITDAGQKQLGVYLQQYADFYISGGANTPLVDNCLAYFLYPFLAFLLGFCTINALLLPLMCTAQGFFLSFAVGAFTNSYGSRGLLMALSTIGLRSLITIPCTLYIAVCAMHTDTKWLPYEAKDYIRFGICVCLLFLGAVLDTALAPKFIHLLFVN